MGKKSQRTPDLSTAWLFLHFPALDSQCSDPSGPLASFQPGKLSFLQPLLQSPGVRLGLREGLTLSQNLLNQERTMILKEMTKGG